MCFVHNTLCQASLGWTVEGETKSPHNLLIVYMCAGGGVRLCVYVYVCMCMREALVCACCLLISTAAAAVVGLYR